jgi:hypothetical protein
MDIDPSPTSFLASAKQSSPSPQVTNLLDQIFDPNLESSLTLALPPSQAVAQPYRSAHGLCQGARDGTSPGRSLQPVSFRPRRRL